MCYLKAIETQPHFAGKAVIRVVNHDKLIWFYSCVE